MTTDMTEAAIETLWKYWPSPRRRRKVEEVAKHMIATSCYPRRVQELEEKLVLGHDAVDAAVRLHEQETSRRARAERQRGEAKEAFKKYGGHSSLCSLRHYVGVAKGDNAEIASACDCGFDDAFARLTEEGT